VAARLYRETLPNGKQHDILKETDVGGFNDTQEFVVPPGTVFAMGDNRDNSSDSRDPNGGVGYIPMENLLGRAEFIFFSVDATAPWWQFWQWPFEIRWSRILSGIN
jgi:signal peptidase I